MAPGHVIGVDAGGTKLLGATVGEDLELGERVRHTWAGEDRDATVELIAAAVEQIRSGQPDIGAVGLGVPSLVDWATGVSRWSNHLPIDDLPLRDLMTERLGLPVVVDNDANAAALAEHRFGAAKGCESAVLVALGTGIGGAMVIDGRVYRGAHGWAGEFGHVVVDHDGADCPGACPGRGCLEALASGRAIGVGGERAARAAPDSPLGRRLAESGTVLGAAVTQLAHDGDEIARAVLADVGTRLGAGLTGIVNVLDPDIVVIGGGAVSAGDLLLDSAREVVAARALPPVARETRIVAARFGEEAGVLGAGLLARELL
jgi:glucokinase